MTRIESGPAAGDRNFFALVVLIGLGMCGWFLYDWQIGWPSKNEKAAAEQLVPLTGADPEEVKALVADLDPEPTEPTFESVEERVRERARLGEPFPVSELYEALGTPIYTKPAPEPELEGSRYVYFASQTGYATVVVSRDAVRLRKDRSGVFEPYTMNWSTWYKSRAEVEQQKWWSLIPLAFALYFAYKLYLAMTLRVVLDERGLQYRNQLIPYEAMKDLRDYSPKGWIDLYYQDGGAERKLRLDNQKFRRFDEVVHGICEQKGFRDELQAHQAEHSAPQASDSPEGADTDPDGKSEPSAAKGGSSSG